MSNHNNDNMPADPTVRSFPAKTATRRRRFAIFFIIVGLIAIAAAVYWWLDTRFSEDTDDAYVAGNVVQVTAQIPGTVTDILADNTQYVRAGQELVKLDDTEVAVALAQAKAQLALAVRQAKNANIGNTVYQEAVQARQAELAMAQRALAARDHASVEVVSPEELAHARETAAVAQANLVAAEAQLSAAQTLTGKTPVADTPPVVEAAEQLKLAYVNDRRASIVSPIDGTVAQSSVQIGARVGPGVPLMSIIPLNNLWVEANFKEGQIRNMRVGQPVRLVSDVYGSQVLYHGHVQGFSAGTGSAFSMLPSQNATGNWIKVVQRVPIVIVIDPADLAAHPLRLGLSMQVSVDTHQRTGHMIAMGAPAPAQSTRLPDQISKQADALAAKIIADNASQ